MAALLALGLLLLAFGLRGFLLDGQSLWFDEAYAIDMARRSFDQILAYPDPGHPPGYYYLLHLWMAATGVGEFAPRFFSVLLGTLAVALVGRLGKELFGRRAGLWAAALAALSPFWVAYSQEVRMYALVLVLSLASVLLWWRLLREGTAHGWLWVGLSLVSAAALWAHYSAAFVLAFQGGFLGLRCLWPGHRDWGLLARGVAALAGVVLLYLPWLGMGLGQVAEYGYGFATAPSFIDQVERLWFGFALGMFAKLEQAWPYLVVTALAVVLGAGLALRQARGRGGGGSWAVIYGVLYLGIPLAAFLFAVQLRPFFHPKYIIAASAGLYLLLGLTLASTGKWLSFPLAGVIVIGGLFALNNYYFNPDYAKDDGRGVVRFLGAEVKEDDLVLWETPLPLTHYYRGLAPAATLQPPASESARTFGYNIQGILPPNTYLVSLGEEPAVLNRLAQGAKRVFYVSWVGIDDPWGRVQFLLEKHGRRQGFRWFRGYNVFWYRVAPGTVFSLGEIGPTLLNFGGQVALAGVAFGGQGDAGTAESGGVAWVTLRWKGLRLGELPLKYYVHLRDQSEVLVAQSDGLLYNSRGRTTPYWTEGEETFSFVRLFLRPGSPPGEYELEVGLYEADTLRRIGALGATGVTVVGRLRVTPPATPPLVSSLSMARPVARRLGALELLGFDPPKAPSLQSGDAVAVTLYWQAASPVAEGEPLVALFLRDEADRVLGRQEAVPLAGRHPPSRWQEGDIFWERRRFLVPAATPAGDYRLILESGGDEIALASLKVTERERSFAVPPMQRAVGASFEEGIELLGFDLEPEGALRPGQSLRLTLYWKANSPVGKGYTVFTHLLDVANGVRAQHDGPPEGGRSPTTSWVAGQVVADEHIIELAKDTPAGRYELEVGLYDPLSGQRLPLSGGEDRVVLGGAEVAG